MEAGKDVKMLGVMLNANPVAENKDAKTKVEMCIIDLLLLLSLL
jgi:hypothetical protein